MRLDAFDYRLRPELIAQRPIEPRDAARLLVLHRASGDLVHAHVRELPGFLEPGDLLVANDSRVLAARLLGTRVGGGPAELLLVARRAPAEWEALVRPARRLRVGSAVLLKGSAVAFPCSRGGAPPRALIVQALDGGRRLVRFVCDGAADAEAAEALALACGEVPLPPYVRVPLADPERYQTVYAREPGSVAAPTAGLHFTPALLAALASRGVGWVTLTLHVGPATFQPVRVADVRQHRLAPELAALSPEAAAAVQAAKSAGRRVVAVGTTVVRTLEMAARMPREDGASGGCPDLLAPFAGPIDIFIHPPFDFRVVDALLTNFHLPRSTLLMLVCAFAGRERVLAAYEAAMAAGYRLYSFGDAVLIL